jgi:hypothetical protein
MGQSIIRNNKADIGQNSVNHCAVAYICLVAVFDSHISWVSRVL